MDNLEKNKNSYGDSKKIEILVNFANELGLNSKSIEPEFLDIVNENFWDLIG